MVALVVALTLVVAAPINAKQPLRGDIDLDFNVGVVLGIDGVGCNPAVAWFGTVEIDGTEYGIEFDDGPMTFSGPVAHWIEVFRIYDSLTYTMDDGIVTSCIYGYLLLEGTVEGIMAPNGGGPANGVVTDAFGDFAEWNGRHVHMFGWVTEVYEDGPYAEWGLPKASAMTMRLN